ncbi:V-set and immunoglobulin domain-containing protein 2-like isoform X2 [Stegostoma tigrinum]|uniref:V-set and immunoglobulin domain-containing protein 2-like isoform X2 n=1 Tax=Stegostoma tigrinum TaxID=3053191 RepID=UPI00202AE499|nr:V-set and immunoglobulin domain-containing protein 2-like isoform X2 [Stegostoma tigrinum]
MLRKSIWILLLTLYFDNVQSIYVVTDTPNVVVNVGNNATLDCSYRTQVESAFSLEWRFTPGPKGDGNAEKILYYTDGKTYRLGPQANRIKLVDQNPTNGIASIRIENTRPSDTGTYSCDINNPPDFTGTSEAFVNLIVQVAPSIPECKVIGKPYVGNNVTLLCRSSIGQPSPKYAWSDVNPGIEKSSSRVMVKDSNKGTLFLRNLTMEHSGTYKCVSSNILGERSCQLVLRVTVSNEAGVIVGAVVATLIALILIAVVAFYLLRHKKKNPKIPVIGHELREDAVAPGKEATSHLMAPSVHSSGTNSDSMNTKYNIVV